MSVILHLENYIGQIVYPFKFNSVCLEEPEFVNLVRERWNGLLGNETLNPMDALVKKLKLLKSLVINRERKKKLAAKEELLMIEMELDTLYINSPEGFEKEEENMMVLEKEKKKMVRLR
jgi:hypothetical protein